MPRYILSYALLSAFLLCSCLLRAQTISDTGPWSPVPSYPGGEKALYKFLSDSTIYPQLAIQNRIEGKVVIGFAVDKDGSVSDIKVLKDIGGGCGEEAVRVMKLMPKWIPAKQQNGQIIPVRLQLPFTFKLPEKKDK